MNKYKCHNEVNTKPISLDAYSKIATGGDDTKPPIGE